ncbi:hypothetical protein DPMN_031863 [Dreissena polymorpha]|uniref:Uncharacterized protein n=1 Tax=Dreissena polymorpha TaxID=45954 RepID=A0A9D4RHG1_DREPO|nr:hypothetical protein DPMN_031863 [Dreissena polymorpha]
MSSVTKEVASELTSDLSLLENLTEDILRKALRERYEHGLIYVSILQLNLIAELR